MQILVTGITGFVGAYLARRLGPEHTLYAIVRQLPSVPMVGVSYRTVDLATAGALETAIAEGKLPPRIDAVISLAFPTTDGGYRASLVAIDAAVSTVLVRPVAPGWASVVPGGPGSMASSVLEI